MTIKQSLKKLIKQEQKHIEILKSDIQFLEPIIDCFIRKSETKQIMRIIGVLEEKLKIHETQLKYYEDDLGRVI